MFLQGRIPLSLVDYDAFCLMLSNTVADVVICCYQISDPVPAVLAPSVSVSHIQSPGADVCGRGGTSGKPSDRRQPPPLLHPLVAMAVADDGSGSGVVLEKQPRQTIVEWLRSTGDGKREVSRCR